MGFFDEADLISDAPAAPSTGDFFDPQDTVGSPAIEQPRDTFQPNTSTLGRIGRNLFNLGSNARDKVADSAIGLYGIVTGAPQETTHQRQQDYRGWMREHPIIDTVLGAGVGRTADPVGAPQGWQQQAAEIATGEIAPTILAAAASPIKGASFLGKLGAEGVRGALVGAASGDPIETAKSAAMWGAGGGVASIPGKTAGRALFRTAGQAAVPVAAAAIDPEQDVMSQQTLVDALVQGGTGAALDPVTARGVRSLFGRKAPVPAPATDATPSAPEGYSTPMPPPRELTEWEIGQRQRKAENAYAERMKFFRRDDTFTTAPAEGDVFANVPQRPRVETPAQTQARLAEEHLARLRSVEPNVAPSGMGLLRRMDELDGNQGLTTSERMEGDAFANVQRRQLFPAVRQENTAVPAQDARPSTTATPMTAGNATTPTNKAIDLTKDESLVGQGPRLAVKLDDGTILHAGDLRLHYQLLDAAGIDPARVIDSGWYGKLSGEFRPGASDAKRAGEEARRRLFQKSEPTAMKLGSNAEAGAINPATLQTLGGATAGGLYGATQGETNEERATNAALGALGVGGGVALFKKAPDMRRSILRRSADFHNDASKQTLGNRLAATVTGWTRLGEEAPAQTSFQRGAGWQNTLADELEAAKRAVSPELHAAVQADPKMQRAIANYTQSRGGTLHEADLRKALPKEYADMVVAAHKTQRLVQQEGAKAEGPGKRGTLLTDTEGTYKARNYGIFTEPKAWVQDQAAFDRVVAKTVATGTPREQAVRELNEYLAGLRKGGGFDAAAADPKISQNLYIKRQDIDADMRKLLGEITDPTQVQMLTAQKLLKNADSFRTINELSTAVRPNGMPMIMEGAALDAAKKAGKDVSDYARLPDTPSLGKLAGKYAPVKVVQQIAKQENIAEKFFSHPTVRSVSSIPKAVVTVGNWATHARQWAQVPFFVLAGRGNPTLIPEAINALRDKSNPLWREMRENGIVGANFSANEFNRAASKIGVKQGLFSKAWDNVKSLYGLPDDLVRVLSYVTAKKRYGGDINKAVEHVNRFNMNYGAQSRAVNLARNLPIVNPFISFVSEMMRVSKNLADEAVNGATVADKAWSMAALGGLWGAGVAASAGSKALLTKAEREEWDQMEKLMPSWQRIQEKTPLHGVREMLGLPRKNSAGGNDFIGLNSLTPTGDLLGFAKALSKGDWEAVFADNPFVGLHKSPLVSAMIDTRLMMAGFTENGEHHFTGQDIKSHSAAFSRLSEALMPPLAGYESPTGQGFGGFEGKKLSRLVRGEGKVVDARSGREDTAGKAFLRNLGGVNVQSVNKGSLLRRAAYQRDEAIREADAQAKSARRNATSQEQRDAINKRRLLQRKEAIALFKRKTS